MTTGRGSVIQRRYELRDEIGRGGMGVVYRAYDTIIEREVAIKTVLETGGQQFLQSFKREWAVLASLHHPNIIEIYDIGEFRERGERRPFFVMPLLVGHSLDRLIHNSRERLEVGQVVDIVRQVCRGLQAAHDHQLIHRDVKPSNVLVLGRNAVKLIDFGIAHLRGGETEGGAKGTPFYMAPEQVRREGPTPQTDIFALGVVCYEALAGRRPFTGTSEAEVAAAIERQVPPPVHEINREVSELLSRVVHKAMAKKPVNRFQTAAEFEDALVRAIHNEPIASLDPARVAPRMEQALKALESRDFDYADEILSELEDQGFVSGETRTLRQRLESALTENKVRSLVADADRYLSKDEPTLALRRVNLALDLNPKHPTAQAVKGKIERRQARVKVEECLDQARQSLAKGAFGRARRALEKAREYDSTHHEVLALLAEAEQREKERDDARLEKQQLLDGARKAFSERLFDQAISKAARWLKLDDAYPERMPHGRRQMEDIQHRAGEQQQAAQQALKEIQKLIDADDLERAESRCKQFQERHGSNERMASLLLRIAEKREQRRQKEIAAVEEEVTAEADFSRRLRLIAQARDRYPDDSRLEGLQRATASRKHLVESVLKKASDAEKGGDLNAAREQWITLRRVHPAQPGIDEQIERLDEELSRRKKESERWRLLEQVDQAIASGKFAEAASALDAAGEGAIADAEIARRREWLQAVARAGAAVEEADRAVRAGEFQRASELLEAGWRIAVERRLDETPLRETLRLGLESAVRADLGAADPLLRLANQRAPDAPWLEEMAAFVRSERAKARRTEWLNRIEQHQSAGDLKAALAEVGRAEEEFPASPDFAEARRRILGAQNALDEQRREREIEELIESRRFSDAARQANEARVLYPESERLEQLRQRIKAGSRQIRDSLRLISEGAQALREGRWEQARDLLLQAVETDLSGNAPQAALDCLRSRARNLPAGAVDEAEGLLATAREIDPGSDTALEIENRIRGLGREQEVGESLRRAEALRGQGDLDAAAAAVNQTLHMHPGQEQLEKLRAELGFALRDKARVAVIACIQSALSEGRLDDGQRQLEQAQREFPDDAEIAALSSRALQLRDRSQGADQLFADLKQQIEQDRVQEALDLLSQSMRSQRLSGEFRRKAAALLTRKAQALIARDWRLADQLLQRAVALDPDSASAGEAVRETRVIRHDDLVRDCLTQARQAEIRGDLPAALEVVISGLKIAPQDQQLLGVKDDIERRLESSRDRLSGEVPVAGPQTPVNPQRESSGGDAVRETRVINHDDLARECLTRARQAEIRGDLTGALGEISSGLKLFPRDQQLLGMKDVIERRLESSPRPAARAQTESARSDAVGETRVLRHDDLARDCFLRARQAEIRADLPGALTEVSTGLKLFPQDQQLLRMKDDLERRLENSRQRASDLTELRTASGELQALGGGEVAAKRLLERTRAIAAAHPDDVEMSTLARDVERRLAQKGKLGGFLDRFRT